MKFVLLKHIKDQAREREIDIKIIEAALLNPEQIVPEPTVWHDYFFFLIIT